MCVKNGEGKNKNKKMGWVFQEGDRNLGQHFTGKTCDRQALFAYLYSFVCHIAACQ